MQYKLYREDKIANNDTNVIKNFLLNRGINDYDKYINLNESVVQPYNNLDNINDAVKIFVEVFNKRSKIEILIDEDVDGICSAAMMYSYIKKLDNTYPVKYILHNRSKAHGLDDDIVIDDDCELLIIPDAGTNDVKQCEDLHYKNKKIIILDHHNKEVDNNYAIIVNNQSSNNYSNKNLCGAGIVYRFLQALDEYNWTEYADEYLDLVALANISDLMDIRSFETKYLIEAGLNNITNKCFDAFIKAQEYSLKGIVNIHNIQFYITPLINAMVRVGSLEDKELLFKAFIEEDCFFEYKKRATKNSPATVINEDIYSRAVRLCKNAKSRQDKLREKSFVNVENILNDSEENKIIICDTTDAVESSLTGVIAIKIAEAHNKPCILLNKYYNKDLGKEVYRGSARNINDSPIENLLSVTKEAGIQAAGHDNAFGIIDLEPNKIEIVTNNFNKLLKDVIYDSVYKVDYILDLEDVSMNLILDFASLDKYVGTGIDEPLIAIEDIYLTSGDIEVVGKNFDTIIFNINGIKYVNFKCNENNPLFYFINNTWEDNEERGVTINLVGKPSINDYEGILTPQIIIKDIEIVKQY